MQVIKGDIKAIAGRQAKESFDSLKLCNYGRLLATVAKARAEDEPEDDQTPDELAEKAEKLVRAMREARK
jgi:hypothetical protein